MSRVLVIQSSARRQDSASNQLIERFVANWSQHHPQDQVQIRDVAAEPLPHLDMDLLAGWMTPAEGQSETQRAAAQRSDLLTEELLAADLLVIGAPMYNFGIPSALKAWFDHVLRAGVTFKYTETGPVGLLKNKRAVVISSRGGIYAGGELDRQEPYLRQVLGFIGINDVEFVFAEGLNLGADAAAKGLEKAHVRIDALS